MEILVFVCCLVPWWMKEWQPISITTIHILAGLKHEPWSPDARWDGYQWHCTEQFYLLHSIFPSCCCSSSFCYSHTFCTSRRRWFHCLFSPFHQFSISLYPPINDTLVPLNVGTFLQMVPFFYSMYIYYCEWYPPHILLYVLIQTLPFYSLYLLLFNLFCTPFNDTLWITIMHKKRRLEITCWLHIYLQ